MTTSAPRMMFVNLPVSDLERSRAYFGELGFAFNDVFSDSNAASLVINEQAIVMLLARPFFSTFVSKPVADDSCVEVAVALSADSRDEVDALVDKALALGGSPVREPQDEGFMYGRSFYDLDGHLWELIWMDPAAVA
ncbi:VOC family protein [Nocardioides iriomotensis]|nr:VOC family protein [Nocardioides iriomotensis]